MIKVIEGDLLKAPVGIIGHQVNCQGVMGSGIALQIKKKWPEVYHNYFEFCRMKQIPSQLLGNCQFIQTNDVIIANLFAQENYGYDKKQYTRYAALHNALIKLRDYAEVHKLTVGLPYLIGCDRGGGWWDIVYKLLDELFSDINLLTLYKWKG